MDSILLTIRKALGVEDDYDGFDTEILMHINTAIFTLSQLGVGPVDGYSVTGIEETWELFLTGFTGVDSVKTYIYLTVRLLFDPPANSFLVSSFEKQIEQLQWRLMVKVDPEIEEEV